MEEQQIKKNNSTILTKTRINAGIIFILVMSGFFISSNAITSSELDEICDVNGSLLKRISGFWTCYNLTETNNTGINISQGDGLVFSVNPIINNGTISLANASNLTRGGVQVLNCSGNNSFVSGWNESGSPICTVSSSSSVLNATTNTTGLVMITNCTSGSFFDGYYANLTPKCTTPSSSSSSVRYAEAFTDFHTNTATANPPFTGTATSAGTSGTISGNGSFPGIVSILDSTTANGGYRWQTPVTNYWFTGNESFVGLVQFPVTTAFRNGVMNYIGFHDATSITQPVDGCYFRFNMSVIRGECRNNAGPTVTSTSFSPVNNTWYYLYINMSLNAGVANFSIYNLTNSQMFSDNVSYNIPTTSARVFGVGVAGHENSTDAAGSLMNLDYMLFTWGVTR